MIPVDETAVFKWLGGIVVMLLGGLGYRRMSSRVSAERARDGADVAKSEAESSYFGTALDDLKTDRDNWRDTAEQAWATVAELTTRVTRMEGEIRHWKSDFALRLKLIRRQYPDLDLSLLDSGPAPLDDNLNPRKER